MSSLESPKESLASEAKLPILKAKEKLTPIQIQEFETYLKTLTFEESKNQLGKINSKLQESLDIEESDIDIQKSFSEMLENCKKNIENKSIDVKIKKTDITVEEKNNSMILSAAATLNTKIHSLSGGKSPKDLIPNYKEQLEKTQKQLESKGKDPKLAESIVLLASESEIIKSIETSTGKILTTQDRKELEQSFSSLRNAAGDLAPTKREGLPKDIALANPQVTLEVYTKIKDGFIPQDQVVRINPTNGELISAPAVITGERTVMDLQGKRFRERSGLRIPSDIPTLPDTGLANQNLALKQQELAHRTRTTETMARVIGGESKELFPPAQFPDLKLPDLSPKDPGKLKEELQKFFESPGYHKLTSTPEHKPLQQNLEARLKQLYLSSIQQQELTKNIKTLSEDTKGTNIHEEITKKDRIIDRNLETLTMLGFASLGQEKYKLLLDCINNKRKNAESLGDIKDTEPIAGTEEAVLRENLIRLTGMTKEQMYPDGYLSPEASKKLQNIRNEDIEAMFRNTGMSSGVVSTTVSSQK